MLALTITTTFGSPIIYSLPHITPLDYVRENIRPFRSREEMRKRMDDRQIIQAHQLFDFPDFSAPSGLFMKKIYTEKDRLDDGYFRAK